VQSAQKCQVDAAAAQHPCGQIGQYVDDEQVSRDSRYVAKHVEYFFVDGYFSKSGAKLRKISV